MATRVKFEANDIVRVLTPDSRDILYKLAPNETVAVYMSEVRIENQYQAVDLSKLKNYRDIKHKIVTDRNHKLDVFKNLI